MAAIKHVDAELDRFIASKQLEKPIVTSLVARKTLWDATGWVQAMTGGDRWLGDVVIACDLKV